MSLNLVLMSMIVWLVMLVTAVIGGAVREKAIAPKLGELRASQVETIALAVLFALLIATFVVWMQLAPMQALAIGIGWCALTIGFETFMGLVLLRQSWDVVLGNYNLAAGKFWPIVLAVILVVPYLAASRLHP
ncbi:MAG: hypothetical protein SFW36_15305 [Leptolyngbyaceae cyanobacterium bins.59]|nr:hypothetical protein [Leptolyngbyaceae cyanobacterium bins.59]